MKEKIIKLSRHILVTVSVIVVLMAQGCANLKNETLKTQLVFPVRYKNIYYTLSDTVFFNVYIYFECVDDLVSVTQQMLVKKNYKITVIPRSQLVCDDICDINKYVLVEHKNHKRFIMAASFSSGIYFFTEHGSRIPSDISHIMIELLKEVLPRQELHPEWIRGDRGIRNAPIKTRNGATPVIAR
jgi:hypothetical protein